jgi:ankyrin repeat protein
LTAKDFFCKTYIYNNNNNIQKGTLEMFSKSFLSDTTMYRRVNIYLLITTMVISSCIQARQEWNVYDFLSFLSGTKLTGESKQLKKICRDLRLKYHPDKNWDKSVADQKIVAVLYSDVTSACKTIAAGETCFTAYSELQMPKPSTPPAPVAAPPRPPKSSLIDKLVIATISQDSKEMLSLFKQGANPNEQIDKSTVLIKAIEWPVLPNIIEILLDHGANIDELDSQGRSPLYVAARAERKDLVKVLLKHNPNLGIHLFGVRRTILDLLSGLVSRDIIELIFDYKRETQP